MLAALSRLSACSILLLALAVVCPRPASAQTRSQPPSSPYIEIDGYAVHGYARGQEIGYQWYETLSEAQAAKASMERVETTNGKYYDHVEIKREKRRVSRNNRPGRPAAAEPAPQQPNARPGSATLPQGSDSPHSGGRDPNDDEALPELSPEQSASSAQILKPADPQVISPRDRQTGARYEVSPDSEHIVTLHNGKSYRFTNHAKALEYMRKINANPAWRATIRETPRAGSPQGGTPQTRPAASRSTPNAQPSPSPGGFAGRFKDQGGRVYVITENGGIYSGGERIGSWSVAGENVRMDFNKLKPVGGLTLAE